MKHFLIPLGLVVMLLSGVFAWHYLQVEDKPFMPVNDRMSGGQEEPIAPIPLMLELDPQKVALGDRLFHERRLSHDNTIACAHCHNLQLGGTDRLPVSFGINGSKGPINSPTVFNSGFNFRQFWDGRAATLEEQVNGPTHAPGEMGSNWPEILGKLRADPDYVRRFAAIYADGITATNIRDAIATFERSLYTPNSRFDRFLRGDNTALTTQEKNGYNLFKNYGCISCHQGINIGGNMYQTFGVMGNYFADRGDLTDTDLGRYNITGHEADKFVFKVPTLRNIALTAPYFHDGSAETLEDAVKIMGRYQLGRPLSPQDIKRISAFLQTLSGEYQGAAL